MAVGNGGLLDGLRRVALGVRELVIGGGIPGAPLGFRIRGATVSGPPATGTWRVRDAVLDSTGVLWACTAGGSPGTWTGLVTLSTAQAVSGTKTFSGLLALSGTLRTTNIATKSANYTVSAATDYIILVNAVSGVLTITLPDATTCAGQQFVIKKTDASGNRVNVTPSLSQVIDTLSTWPVYSQEEGVTVISDGANWHTVSSVGSVQDLDVNGVLATNGLECFGPVTATGTAALSGGTDTSATAAASTPTFVSGTALQLNTTQDVMLYITVVTATSTTLAIGPTSTPANTIFTSKSPPANTVLTFRIPKGWFVKITGTIADYSFLQVTC